MRSTLINSVTQSIPTYTMSSFNIPNNVYNKLDFLSRRLLRKPKKIKGRFLALTTWDNLCKLECKGGLGFKKAKQMNNALLAKLAWMVASKEITFVCLSWELNTKWETIGWEKNPQEALLHLGKPSKVSRKSLSKVHATLSKMEPPLMSC